MSGWIVRGAIFAPILIGILVLLGWQFDAELLKVGFPGNSTSMKANTALCFVLAGLTVGLLQRAQMSRTKIWRQRFQVSSFMTAGVIISIGLLTLSEYLFGWNLGIDELLFEDIATSTTPNPGRMAASTAIQFVLLGHAFWGICQQNRRGIGIAQFLSCGVALLSLQPLFGYLFKVNSLYTLIAGSGKIAPHTAIAFLTLCLGVLSLYPHQGLMQTITSPLLGGRIARFVMPWAIALPFLLNWFVFWGEHLGWYSPEFADASRTTLTIIFLVALIWWTARSLNQTEQQRQAIEHGLQELNYQFRQAIINAPIPMMLHAEDGEVVQISRAWTEITGYLPEEISTIAAWVERAYGERKDIMQEGIRKLYALTQPVAEHEFEIRTRRGEIRIWDFFTSPIGKLSDNRRIIMSAAIDTTERKRAENALQQLNLQLEQSVVKRTAELSQINLRLQQELSERKQLERELAAGKQLLDDFFNAASTANIGLCIHDAELRYLKINQALAKINGLEIQEHLGKQINHLLPGISSTVTALLHQVLQTGQPIANLEITGTTADLRAPTRSWQAFYFPIFNHENQVNAVGVMIVDISDRKRAEANLQQYQRMIAATADGMVLLDRNYVYQVVNQTYLNWFGKKTTEIVGHSVSELVGQEVFTTLVKPNLDKCLAGQIVKFEMWFDYPVLKHQFLSVTYAPYHEADQTISGIVVSIRNLTELKQTETALRWSEVCLRSMFEQVAIGVVNTNLEGGFLRVNQTFANMLGYTPEELLQMNFSDVTDPDDLDASITAVQQLATQQCQTIALEKRYRRRDGSYLWGHLTLSLIEDTESGIRLLAGIIQDISDRKRIEAEHQQAEHLVRASEARYRGVVEDQTELICRYLPDGTITFINGAYCRYFGLNYDDMLGKSYAPVVLPEDQDQVNQLVQSMSPTNPTVLIENRVVVGEEVRWTQWINRMLFDEQGQFLEYQSVGRDISALKQAEADLQKQQALLSGIITGSQDIIGAVDCNLHLIAFNQAYHDEFFKLYGYDVQIGTDLVEALTPFPQQQAQIIGLWKRAIAGEEFSLIEKFGTRGRYQSCYDASYSTIRNRRGEQIGATLIARDVSDRLRTEQLLRESEERYRSVVAAMAEGVTLQQASGEIIAWNESAKRILGLTAEQMLGQTSIDLDRRSIREDGTPFPGEEHPAMITLRTGEPQSNVIMGIRKTEICTTWISINCQPLFHPEQTLPYAAVSSFTDITVHRQAEAKLRESEARFRSAFDDAAIGMALVGLDGKFLQVNRALSELVGYSPEEMLQLDFQTITHPDDLYIDLAYAEQLLKGEIQRYQLEKRYVHKQQRIVWILLNGSIVRDPDEQPLYFIAQVQDISDRKQAEQALELQAVITRNIAEGVCLIRISDGMIVYANPKFEQMFGYEPGELNGQSVAILNYSDQSVSAEAVGRFIIQEVIRAGEFNYEVHNIRKDGTSFWCRATASMFDHPEYGNVLVAVQQDITERKHVEEQIKASLREKEVLLKEIHHRVKNNLQIVDGLLKMQARRTQDPQVNAVLRDSQSRIASIALVHEKLYGSADLANIDFAQYIQDLTVHLFESYSVYPDQVRFHNQVNGIFLDIETAIPCGLIINELISNALKYAFPERRVGDIYIQFYPIDEHLLCLVVQDNGIGLPKDFDITKTRSLGMTLIQGLVDQLEGNMVIEQIDGTEFRITFTQERTGS